jgi:hypothetical protein
MASGFRVRVFFQFVFLGIFSKILPKFRFYNEKELLGKKNKNKKKNFEEKNTDQGYPGKMPAET